MTFNCTLVGGPGSPKVEPPVELSIDAPLGTSGSVIHQQLVRKFGAGAVSVDGEDLCSLVLGIPPLVEAAIFVDGGTAPLRRRPKRRPVEGPAAPLALMIDSGPAAGTVVRLQRGSYSIGRSGTRIVIPDPELSREHARVIVTETDIMLVDLDSANGSYVNGERIRSAVISTDSNIRCGQSNLSLVFAELPVRVLADAGKSVADPIVVAGRVEAGNRPALLLAAVLPLVIGVLLAMLTGMWMFLVFSLGSAFPVLVTALSGRRQKQKLSAAVHAAAEEDRKRRRRCAPPLSLVALAAETGKETARDCSGADGIWLRVGQAEQAPNVRVEPAGAAHVIPPSEMAPVLLDPDRPLTTVGGPRFATDGLIRSLLMQLAGYPRGRTTHVVVHGTPGTLPLAARYLCRVTLTATVDAGLSVLNGVHPGGCERGVLLIRGEPSTAEAEKGVREAALRCGWQVLHFLPDEGEWPPPDVLLAERRSVALLDLRETVFVPDLVPEDVFTRFCRRRAGQLPEGKGPGSGVPAVCSLGQVLPLTPEATADRWGVSAEDDGLAAPLGLSSAGTKFIDLHADGPHLLVAGTTGSGKSELLRSLTLALALSHPPERVNFFFVDFKGGSGLGPLAGLVHCVGLQTDLSNGEMDRTLTSLRAEVRLRESCLSAARVPDISAYRSTPAARDFVLPHLVIVIDEFRMLVDDAPEVLRELLRIAAIGRSLGIHLVMATQRPQGALTADIRANVTSSIALRVQSEMESVDIVNSKDAAAISVDSPGRAFLARGAQTAEEFQGASLASPSGVGRPAAVDVHRTTDYLAAQGIDVGHGAATVSTPAQAVEPLTAMVRNLCAAQEKELPRRPVAPPLPEQLEEPTPANPTCDPCQAEPMRPVGGVRLGLMDVPEKQRVEALVWDLAHHGHAAFIGSPASGAAEGLQLAVSKLMLGPAETHFYLLDGLGGFLPLARAGRTGAYAGLHELRRGVRILERLVRELGQRLASQATGRIPLVLAISGWGSWVSAFRSGPLAWAEDLVNDLVRDGARVGITLLLSGERELVTARFFGALPNRFYFPSGSTEESRAMWPRLPSVPAIEGRAAAFGPVSGGGPALCQFYRPSAPDSIGNPGYPRAGSPPFRVEPLPATITVRQIAAMAGQTGAGHVPEPSLPGRALVEEGPFSRRPGTVLPSKAGRRQREILLGVSGDELAPVTFRLPGAGVIGILGGPGSGKTNTLHALQELNPEQSWCTCPGPSEAAGNAWGELLVQAEAGKLPLESILLVDDVDLLAPPAVRDLGQLNALGYAAVVTAAFSPALLQRVPLIMNARASGLGLLLCPRSAADGDLFGGRFETEASPPPGRGVLISGGRSCPLQVAWAGK
ncbi:S-DNA-T family DNA segregation ATPase FtsK/SpoIIIE [Arthrobacter oryzae]|uniref:FtsK/SpoIIIE domain-containing protein n=1 Tax=Arthrobacter TaxID=1663 RepID=UPI001F031A05|nr:MULTISPECIES: FtsK/SpoIIIE domain-containing protein [Arthrobacter]MDP9985085.1 S-DNA-T family DNA segregation ATPase FtsK/SpoIIIE [Arthrobacter oryzae]UKA69834.1 FHA domain-containing protein [Arthrobacter sp. FW306-06-A]